MNIKSIFYNKDKALVNGLFFSLFSFVNRGFSFLLVILLANYLSTAEYGYLSLFTTVIMIVSYFMALSTEGYLSVSYFKIGIEGIKQTVSGILMISFVSLTAMLLNLLLFKSYLIQLFKLSQLVLVLIVFICFFTLYSNLFLDYFRLKGKVYNYGILSCSNAFLNLIASIILVKYIHLGWMGRVYAQFGCFFLFGLAGILYFYAKGYFTKPNCKFLRKMTVWGLPIIPHLATGFLRQGCDRYIINFYHTIDDVGVFSFALNLANIVVMVGIGFNQSNSVDIYKILGNCNMTIEDKRSYLTKQKKKILGVYVIMTVLIMLFVPLIVPIFVPKYSNSIIYFLILAIWGFAQCLYFLYTNYLFFYNKTKSIMYVTFGTSVLHLLLSLILTRYSLIYTCLVYVLTQFVIFCLIKSKADKILKLNLN